MDPKHIQTLEDIANLTEDEFERFIPDLVLWHKQYRATVQILKSAGFPIDTAKASMTWTDDGKNEITSFQVRCGDDVIVNIKKEKEE